MKLERIYFATRREASPNTECTLAAYQTCIAYQDAIWYTSEQSEQQMPPPEDT